MFGMPNCKEVSRRVSESMDRGLPLFQRMGVWMHLIMCKYCNEFRKQMVLLRKVSRDDSIPESEAEADVKLSEVSKDRIKRAMMHDSPPSDPADGESAETDPGID